MRFNGQGFDARFWGLLIAGSLLAGTFGCLGIAAAAQTIGADATGIISVTDTLRQMEQRNKIREGVMTERLRTGAMTNRVRPEAVILADVAP